MPNPNVANTMIETEVCAHPNPIHAKRGTAIWKQCPACFASVGSAINKSTFEQHQIDAMPIFDETARDAFANKQYERQKEIHNFNRAEESREWWERYNTYLRSPEWQAKRLLVLQRDKYLCQGCLTARASDVHHKTYEHLFREPAFDLESVCRPCHELIHNKPICPYDNR